MHPLCGYRGLNVGLPVTVDVKDHDKSNLCRRSTASEYDRTFRAERGLAMTYYYSFRLLLEKKSIIRISHRIYTFVSTLALFSLTGFR
jgi:hypothetical protein